MTVFLGTAVYLSAGADSLREVLEDSHRILPVDARIGDTDTRFESGGALGGNFLVALIDVGLDHDTNDSIFTLAQLVGNNFGNLGLVVVVFLGVAYYVAS